MLSFPVRIILHPILLAMEVEHNSESRASSDLMALSIIHLIRYFDTIDPKTDSSKKMDETKSESVLDVINTRTDEREPLSEEVPSPESPDLGDILSFSDHEPEPENEEPAQTESVQDQNTQSTRPDSTHHLLRSMENFSEFCGNFRPRESNLAVLQPPNSTRRSLSRNFSFDASHARQWFRRSASVIFPLLKQSELINQDEKVEKSTKPEKSAFLRLSWASAMYPLGKRMSMPFFSKPNQESQLENMVFLPRTHRPSLQNYPTVEDVEDIAEARAEYSVLPEEWSGYLDPMLKSSAQTQQKKPGWNLWFTKPVPIRKLQKKIKSSFASGRRKTTTLRVRFFMPSAGLQKKRRSFRERKSHIENENGTKTEKEISPPPLSPVNDPDGL